MTSIWRSATGALVVFSLAGCADLDVARIKSDDAGLPQYGQLVYYLPQTRIKGTVTITLSECKSEWQAVTDPVTHSISNKPVYTFTADESIAIASATEPDPDFHYAISLKDAQSWLKEINFKLDTNADNTMQAFNGTINDQAGAIAIGTLTAAIKIAGAAILPGVPALPSPAGRPPAPGAAPGANPPPAPPPPPPQICSESIVKALDDIQSAKNKVSAINIRKVDTTTYTQAQKDSDLAAAQTALGTAQKKADLAHTATFSWLPVGANKSNPILTKSYALNGLIQSWLSQKGLELFASTEAADQEVFRELKKSLTLRLTINATTLGDATATTFGPDGKSTIDAPHGIILRQPALATLSACKDDCSVADAAGYADITNHIAPDQAVGLGQFGQLRIYPAHSAVFENANLVIATSPDGTITSVADHETSTAATSLTSLGGAADAASTALTVRNTAITSANSANSTLAGYADSVNKQHADCIAQKNAVEAAGEKALPCQ